MNKVLILGVVAWVVAFASPQIASADDPWQETIDLGAVMHVASLPPPNGSGAAGINSLQMSSFQSGGSTPTANVIDTGQITSPPPPVLADKVLA